MEKDEERRIRELHRQNPVREIPSDTMSAADAARMLRFIAAIRSERESQGLTVEQLAQPAGIDAGVLARIEGGQSFKPTVATLFRIAEAFGKGLTLRFEEAR